MTRKLALVTGGTGGIGLETARGLVRAGLDVIIVGRNRENGAAAVLDLGHDAASGQLVRYEQADLSAMADIRRLVATLGNGPLDVLVNNAGAQFGKRELTADGFERTMATNHFGMFLLTALLVPRLRAALAARIVNVASSIHAIGRIPFNDLSFADGYSTVKSYAASKLANILFTHELALRLGGTGIVANSYNPGAARSDFNGFLKAWWARFFTVTLEQAAATAIYLALASDPDIGSGGYYDNRQRPRRPAPAARNAEAAGRLWAVSETLTGHPFAAVLKAETQPA